jgi:Regulator of cell morphogenesis and NO signaling
VIEIADLFAKIAADLTAHLKEEEEVFYPAVKRAEAASISGLEPAAGGSGNHPRPPWSGCTGNTRRSARRFHAIRHLAKDYAIPSDACNTFLVTYQKLKEFEDDLHKHVHLENNILFPKAAGVVIPILQAFLVQATFLINPLGNRVNQGMVSFMGILKIGGGLNFRLMGVRIAEPLFLSWTADATKTGHKNSHAHRHQEPAFETGRTGQCYETT